MSSIPLKRSALPEVGTYKAKIISVETAMGPSGYEYHTLMYALLNENGKPTGYEVRDGLSMSPKARFRVDAFLDAIGAPEEGNASPKSLKGKTLKVVIGTRIYQGAKQVEVTQYVVADEVSPDVDFDLGGDDDEDEDVEGYSPLDDEVEDEVETTAAELSDEDIPF